MEDKEMVEDSAKKKKSSKRKSNNFGFLFYAIAVFTILAIGLFVIVMRSNQVM